MSDQEWTAAAKAAAEASTPEAISSNTDETTIQIQQHASGNKQHSFSAHLVTAGGITRDNTLAAPHIDNIIEEEEVGFSF